MMSRAIGYNEGYTSCAAKGDRSFEDMVITIYGPIDDAEDCRFTQERRPDETTALVVRVRRKSRGRLVQTSIKQDGQARETR
jgi:hypothetical protein